MGLKQNSHFDNFELILGLKLGGFQQIQHQFYQLNNNASHFCNFEPIQIWIAVSIILSTMPLTASIIQLFSTIPMYVFMFWAVFMMHISSLSNLKFPSIVYTNYCFTVLRFIKDDTKLANQTRHTFQNSEKIIKKWKFRKQDTFLPITLFSIFLEAFL